jgi:hypothetical protein
MKKLQPGRSENPCVECSIHSLPTNETLNFSAALQMVSQFAARALKASGPEIPPSSKAPLQHPARAGGEVEMHTERRRAAGYERVKD